MYGMDSTAVRVPGTGPVSCTLTAKRALYYLKSEEGEDKRQEAQGHNKGPNNYLDKGWATNDKRFITDRRQPINLFTNQPFPSTVF